MVREFRAQRRLNSQERGSKGAAGQDQFEIIDALSAWIERGQRAQLPDGINDAPSSKAMEPESSTRMMMSNRASLIWGHARNGLSSALRLEVEHANDDEHPRDPCPAPWRGATLGRSYPGHQSQRSSERWGRAIPEGKRRQCLAAVEERSACEKA